MQFDHIDINKNISPNYLIYTINRSAKFDCLRGLLPNIIFSFLFLFYFQFEYIYTISQKQNICKCQFTQQPNNNNWRYIEYDI